jgi:hypothetical protein
MYYLDKYDHMLCVDCGADNEENIQCKEPLTNCTVNCHTCSKTIFDNSIHVRLHVESGLYKFYRKTGPKQYELHPDYLNSGFGSRAHAERRAREIEKGKS